jgi:hypothetical protein
MSYRFGNSNTKITTKSFIDPVKKFIKAIDSKSSFEISESADDDYPQIEIRFSTGEIYAIGYAIPDDEFFVMRGKLIPQTRHEPEDMDWSEAYSNEKLDETLMFLANEYANDVMNNVLEAAFETLMDMRNDDEI